MACRTCGGGRSFAQPTVATPVNPSTLAKPASVKPGYAQQSNPNQVQATPVQPRRTV